MNPFDLGLVVLVAFFAIFGFFRGLLRQIFGIGGFVGGLILARLLSQPFGDAFAKDLGVLVRPQELLKVVTAVIRVYIAHGNRTAIARRAQGEDSLGTRFTHYAPGPVKCAVNPREQLVAKAQGLPEHD